MSLLTLVRHAQASFHSDDYDQLSTLGENQGCRLSEHWVRCGRMVDEVYVGPRSRQQRTAELVAAGYRSAGVSFPDPVVLPELDEFDLHGIFYRLAPEFAKTSSSFATLMERGQRAESNRDRERTFQLMFEPLMLHWQSADGYLEGLESWPAFRDRVQQGLKYITQRPGRGRRVVAFTSGGFIATAVHLVLGASARAALEMSWRIRNGALTEFLFTGERMTLDSFNSVAHFADPELLTYR